MLLIFAVAAAACPPSLPRSVCVVSSNRRARPPHVTAIAARRRNAPRVFIFSARRQRRLWSRVHPFLFTHHVVSRLFRTPSDAFRAPRASRTRPVCRLRALRVQICPSVCFGRVLSHSHFSPPYAPRSTARHTTRAARPTARHTTRAARSLRCPLCFMTPDHRATPFFLSTISALAGRPPGPGGVSRGCSGGGWSA